MSPLPRTHAGRRHLLQLLAGATCGLLGLRRPLLGADTQPADDAPPIPVVDEPSHRNVFENAFLRVLDVQLPPGATSRFHWHRAPSVIVYLTKSTNRSESWPKREIITRALTPGQSRYAPYDEKPLAHRVTNTGRGLFRVFDIELLQRPNGSTPLPPLPPAHLKLHWDERLARGSGLTLAAGERISLPPIRAARFLVVTAGTISDSVDGSPAASSPLGWAEFRFFPAQTRLELRAAGPDRAEAVLLEVKS